MNKNIVIVVLMAIIGVFVYFTFFTNDDTLDLIEQEKLKAIQERDKAFKVRDSLTSANVKITDSLRKEEQNIKYVPYEKLIYADRTIDDALDILSNYTYSRTTTED